ncbi:3,4-dihydroxy-2-butanone 4-phosphate synthase [Phialemonium atrogriseum]|uniref:3,4-dihydroxy-2-butanone 4-phosphate synthase n=1 Tax=Phialemonium atrogriseum TaxID=1093897 RepID=A0AAJ0BPC6_9PEZI|nr:3,4-dihydroxy-2-butanone 4-phosphate synthase [Phialemonium atrogriseum]KAK1761725.1 3,4-dihydroxy-2-butanone 4-phosphate synthase [Phialemonium atrogriseum]
MAQNSPANNLSSIPETIDAFARGEFIIVLDNPTRENEGDLIIAAEDLTPSKMAFMIRHTSGYICAPIPESRADALGLPQMVTVNADPTRCAYSITIDGNDPAIGTGISAADRARTCQMLADPATTAASFRRPGHILPLRARDLGVRVRYGHTEAAIEFCRLAGKRLAAVLCEMVLDGEEDQMGKTERVGAGMMRRDDCLAFGKKWGVKVCAISDLVAYVEKNEGRLSVPGAEY